MDPKETLLMTFGLESSTMKESVKKAVLNPEAVTVKKTAIVMKD